MAERAQLDRLALVRALYDGLPEDMIGAFRDSGYVESTRALLEPLLTEGFEAAIVSADGAEVTRHPGFDGIIAIWRDWLDPWETYEFSPEEILDTGDAVLATGVQRSRPRGSTGTVENRVAAVWFFSGDRLSRLEFHLDRAAARESAGVPRGTS